MSLLWSVGIFEEEQHLKLNEIALQKTLKVFDAKKRGTGAKFIHTYADPFLFVKDDILYLLLEVQEVNSKGYIHLWKTSDLMRWEDAGVLLKEDVHLSYPSVFQDDNNSIYLVPESAEANQIRLYKFNNFPHRLSFRCTLLDGPYVDTSLMKIDNTYFLMTTHKDQGTLELYFSNDLESSNWMPHPQNPIATTKLFNRNGGGFLKRNGDLFRIAQNTNKSYGNGIVVMKIIRIDKTRYQEEVLVENLVPGADLSWQKKGRHHLSTVDFNGKSIVAMDGLQSNSLANRIDNFFKKVTG